MNRLTLTLATLMICAGSASRCHAGKKYHRVGTYAAAYAPVGTVAVAPMTYAPVSTVGAVPMTYSVGTVAAAPMTYVPQNVVTYAPMTVMNATTSTLPYSPAVATVGTAQYVSTVAATNFTGNELQFIDVGGLIRSIGCSACRSMGCCDGNSGGGSSSGDPTRDIRDSVEGIKKTIRDFKTIRDELKDIFAEAETSMPTTEVAGPRIATLRRIRDELRSASQKGAYDVRVAKAPK